MSGARYSPEREFAREAKVVAAPLELNEARSKCQNPKCRRLFGGLRARHGSKCCSAKCAHAIGKTGMVLRSRVPKLKQMAIDLADEVGTPLENLILSCKPRMRTLRFELFWRCRQLDPQPSFEEIAVALGFDKSTIVNGVQRHLGGAARRKRK